MVVPVTVYPDIVILDYLLPHSNMKFIDLGCCLNLVFNGMLCGISPKSPENNKKNSSKKTLFWNIETLF